MKPLFSKSNLATLVILIIISILTIVWVNANAETINLPLTPVTKNLNTGKLNNLIGIWISKTCISQIVSNKTITCPSYEQLIQNGYDHSSPHSGKFILKNSLLQREFTKIRNEAIYYLNISNSTIVDPSYLLSLKIKTITIEPNMPTYLLVTDMNKINNTRTLHKDRYVDPQCNTAVISSINWKITLPDTIRYMQNNCSGELVNTKYTINDNATNTDITTSQKYKEDKFKQQVKLDYKNVSKIGTNDKTINKSVTEDKDLKYIPKTTPPFNYSKYR